MRCLSPSRVRETRTCRMARPGVSEPEKCGWVCGGVHMEDTGVDARGPSMGSQSLNRARRASML